MYKEEIVTLQISNESIQLFQVTNIDEVFDQLIESEASGEDGIDERIPYWTELWPSAIAMSEFIVENIDIFNGRSVIEIGSGLALPSLIASRYCNALIVTDYLEDALYFAQRNMVLNGIENVSFDKLDWRTIPDTYNTFDIVLASDLAYEKRFFDALPACFSKLMKKDGITILAEPGRLFASKFIEQLETKFIVEKHDKKIEWREGNFNVGIYVLRIKNY